MPALPYPVPVARSSDAAPGLLWFEVSDLVAYFDGDGAATGIQRVGRDIIEAVGEAAPERLRLCWQMPGSTRLAPLDATTFHRLCRPFRAKGSRWRDSTMAGLRWAARRVMRRLAALWHVVRPGRGPSQGDAVICLGAGWEHANRGALAESLGARGIAYIVLLHDIIPITHPQFVLARENADFESWLESCLRHAALIVTASRYNVQQIRTFAGRRRLAEPRILHLPFGARPATPVRPAPFSRSPARFVLCVATLEGRKNHRLLVEVWRELLRRHPHAAVPDLVLVGKRGWALGSLLPDLAASGMLGRKVHHLQSLSDAQVQGLYAECLFTTVPSLVEGWGLPVAESLAAGKFCLCADRAALPEVGGDFVGYFDPDDLEATITCFERAIFDESYLREKTARIRCDYVGRGWTDYAHDFIAAIRSDRTAQ